MLIFAVAIAQMLALSAIMTGAWAIQRKTGNSGWIDAVWTFGLGAVGTVSALVPLEAGETSQRQLLVAALIGIWAVRLGSHLVWRSSHKIDDPRYAELIKGWGETASRELFMLMLKQALVSLPLALSIFIAAHNPAPGLGLTDILAVLICAVAVLGEALADAQLRAFIATRKGGVCERGLWRFSRHPNYFFEWLYWVSFPVIAADFSGGYPWGFAAMIGPAMMYWLLRYVSGVPPLEAHMLAKHGDLYRDYQRSTNVFFPGPPRHG